MITTTQIAALTQYDLPGKSAAFIDIDQTLLEDVPTTLFSHYGKHFFDLHARHHRQPELQIPLHEEDYIERIAPIERDTVEVYRTLERRVNTLFVITARSFETIDETIKLLEQHDLLPRTPHPHYNGYHEPNSGTAYTVLNNVIFTNRSNKGTAIAHLLKTHQIALDTLLFADNDFTNIQNVEETFPTETPALHLFRYTRVEHHTLDQPERTVHLQAKLHLHERLILDDVATRLFFKTIDRLQLNQELDEALKPHSDAQALLQLIHKYGEPKELRSSSSL